MRLASKIGSPFCVSTSLSKTAWNCLHVHFGEFVQNRQCSGGGVEVVAEAIVGRRISGWVPLVQSLHGREIVKRPGRKLRHHKVVEMDQHLEGHPKWVRGNSPPWILNLANLTRFNAASARLSWLLWRWYTTRFTASCTPFLVASKMIHHGPSLSLDHTRTPVNPNDSATTTFWIVSSTNTVSDASHSTSHKTCLKQWSGRSGS